MLPKVVYAVTCGSRDLRFADWALTSCLALKHIDPGYHAVLCTDDFTKKLLEDSDHPSLKHFDDCQSITTFDGTPRERSRWLKTSLRMMVDGDFIYLDSDAMPIGDLTPVFAHDFDMAIINQFDISQEIAGWYAKAGHDLGWSIPPDKYYNAGVFFIRDTPDTQKFYQQWRSKWLEWRDYDQSGVYADQPSFNSALYESDLQIKDLSDHYNVFLSKPDRGIPNPVVLHYPASIRPMHQSSLLSRLTREFKKTGELNTALITKVQNSENPWVMPKWFVWLEYFWEGFRHKVTRNIRTRIGKRFRRFLVK